MYKLTKNGVRRLADGAEIPAHEGNADWRAFIAWRDAGGVPDAIPAPDPKDAIRSQIEAIERATGVVRVVREGLMMFAELEAARQAAAMDPPTTAAALLALNPGYVRTKAVDDQIAYLRGLLV